MKVSPTNFELQQYPFGLALPNICDNKQLTGDCQKYLAETQQC